MRTFRQADWMVDCWQQWQNAVNTLRPKNTTTIGPVSLPQARTERPLEWGCVDNVRLTDWSGRAVTDGLILTFEAQYWSLRVALAELW